MYFLFKFYICLFFPRLCIYFLTGFFFLILTVKTQVMGEIKIALKREMKTDGEQLVVEILQCRNITYKFKSPDHLPGI